MQSRTSCFNKAIFLNTLKRFWPLWFIYLAVWLLAGPIAMSATYMGKLHSVQRDILDLANVGGVIIGMAYGVLTAMAVWSFMYNSKTMSGVACLPVKREGVFFSATLAGLLPAVISNAVVFALCAAVHTLRGFPEAVIFDLQAFAIVTMMLIFFYGFASLCAQLTGNIVALPLVFLVLNFAAAVVETVVRSLIEVIVFGLNNGGMNVSRYLSPAIGMIQNGPRSEVLYIEAIGSHEVQSIYYQGWGFLAICCVVGVIMLFAAMALYRRRRMESAGDFVAVEVLKPVFKYCMAFGGALCSAVLFWNILIYSLRISPLAEVLLTLFFMLPGAFVGYFAAEMLIRKSFRVFRGKWKGFVVSCLVLCVVVLGLEFNLFGIETRFPDAEDVESVDMGASDFIHYTEPDNIAAIIELHKSVVENKAIHERDTGMGSSFTLSYNLKNGKILNRNYYIRYGMTLEDVEALEEIQNSPEAIAKRKRIPFEATEDKFLSGDLRGVVSLEELLALNPDYSEEDLIIMNYYGYDESYVLKQMGEGEKAELLAEYEKYGKHDMKSYTHHWNFSGEEMWELYSQCIVPDLQEGKVGKLWIVEDEEYFNTVYSARINIELSYTESDVIVSEEAGAMTTGAAEPIPTTSENRPGSGDRKYMSFYTVPTVGSRTEAWLLDHGVILYTVGEEMEMSGHISGEYGKYDY